MDFNYAKKKFQYWLKANYRNGHGVHSPFLFEFFKQVIFTDNSRDDTEMLPNFPNKVSKHDRKYGELINRITKWVDGENVLEIGYLPTVRSLYLQSKTAWRPSIINHECAHGLEVLEQYAKAQSLAIDFIHEDIELFIPKILNARSSFDLMVMNLNKAYSGEDWFIRLLTDHANSNSVIVVNNLHKHVNNEHFWNQMKTESKAKVFLDLFHVGIILFSHQLQREEFVVRY